ncbi:glycosyl transferase family protein [Altererythrobacter endophyticus]|uniref:Glycosyl transferase family protein n=1 Tax=Altericroceibacterium endophyticum TaxID=1808508 RepID=A0A6I4T919_9SPHN|nr:glycosyl transferase family protein [Altericroceibacterium endophyticum]
MDFSIEHLVSWLGVVELELLIFTSVFLLIGALDEALMDVFWFFLRLSGKVPARRANRSQLEAKPLSAPTAVMIAAWQEARVIGGTIEHMCHAWPQANLRIYVGCYCNDPATIEAVMYAAQSDQRVRIVIHDQFGPTTKADCLNRIYRAICTDEARSGTTRRMIVMHDAEDMVDPAALALMDGAIANSDFVQLPVLPEPQHRSRWVGSHYCEEFAEAHGKAMVVRDAIGAALPSAGVGCAFSRKILSEMAWRNAGNGPFSEDSLTEDYELGLRIKAAGGRSRFLRCRGDDGELIATRACFPSHVGAAVRQKARWLHGIALQGWDRMGWSNTPVELWMRWRDRRGPISALVLAAGYLLLIATGLHIFCFWLGYGNLWYPGPLLTTLLALNMVSFVWRAFIRFIFTAREYGFSEGLNAVLRIPLANLIAIMAGRRALMAYFRALGGGKLSWDKTRHDDHPPGMKQARGAQS